MSEKEILECFNELGDSDFCDNYYGLHIIQAIQALLDLYKNSISKDKIRNLILKYRCFGWHDKDDEYWANLILDGFEELLEESEIK